jgi:hypothetical protein
MLRKVKGRQSAHFIPDLYVEAESERDLAWSADRSRKGLHNEFLIQKILHVEEHIGCLMHLA